MGYTISVGAQLQAVTFLFQSQIESWSKSAEDIALLIELS